jgi:dipeptidyl aminopeptidase/acylaminoacyl peptidase
MDVGRQVRYANHFDDDRHSRDDWRQTVQGDAAFDLKTVSPLYTVDRLKVPVLVMHGDKDQRVLPQQSRLYAEALKAAGKVYEYYTIPDDGHGYTNAAAEQAWLDRPDAFLATYNPAA